MCKRFCVYFFCAGLWLFMGIATAFAEEAPDPVTSARILANPFQDMLADIEEWSSLDDARAAINRLKSNCERVEIPRTNGCPESVKILRKVIVSFSVSSLTEVQDAFRSELDSLDELFVEEYEGEERTFPVVPAMPTDVLRDLPERALENPFLPLLDWVEFWDNGSVSPKAVRTNKKFGAQAIIKLTAVYCKKLELPKLTGCRDSLDTLKKARRTGRNQKMARRDIINFYREELGYLNRQFEEAYGGEDRESAVPPDVSALDNPFIGLLAQIKWWDLGRFYPDVIRTKYAKEMVRQADLLCLTHRVPKDTGCQSSIETLSDAIKRFPKQPDLNKRKTYIIDIFHREIEWLAEELAPGSMFD